MGKTETENNETGGFLDLFEIDHSKFSLKEVEETTKEIVDGAEGEDVTDVEDVVNEAPSEKEVSVKETAEVKLNPEETTTEDLGELGSLLQDLVDEDVLVYDSEKEYEVSTQGIKELIAETVSKKVAEAKEAVISSFGEEASNLFDILSKGGTVEDFVQMAQEVDFSKIPLVDSSGKPNTNNQLHLIEDWLQVQGYSKEEIEETLGDYEQGGIIQKQAEIAKKKLTAWQTETRTAKIEEAKRAQEKDIEKKQQEAVAFEKEVKATRSIADFEITKEEAIKLHDFITKPGKDGKTAFEKKDSAENRLLYAYMAMNGFKKDSLVREIATKQAIQLRKKLSNFEDKQANPARSGSTRVSTSNSIKGISWNM